MLSLKVLTNKVLFIKVIKKTVFIGFNNLWLQLILIFIVRNTFYAFLKKKDFWTLFNTQHVLTISILKSTCSC